MWQAVFHPRDARGRFRPVMSADVVKAGYRLERLSDKRLAGLFTTMLDEPTPALTALDLVTAELGRRDEKRMSAPVDEWAALLLADRRKGESRRTTMRRAYDAWTYERYLQAEEATRGHLVTGPAQSAGVSALSLFSGTLARALKWASSELLEWWDDNGGRVTFADFLAGPPVASGWALAR